MSADHLHTDIRADIKSGAKLLLPVEIARLKWLPSRRAGKKLNVSTIHRWFQSGGLECVRAGGTTVTTEAAILRFFARRANPTMQAAPVDHTDAHQQAERELELAGI